MEYIENEDGDISIQQIENSVYVRFHFSRGDWDTYTRRYLDITSVLSADEFTDLSQKIIDIGNKEIVQKMTDFWHYQSTDFGEITTAHEIENTYPYPRHDINIHGYSLVYHPKGTSTNKDYYLSEWNYDVPNYQEGHTYIMAIYGNGVLDSMTDDELLEIAKHEVENLRTV